MIEATRILSPEFMDRMRLGEENQVKRVGKMAGREAQILDMDCYRTIFEHHHTMMLIVNPHDGGIVHANPAALGYYGCCLAEMRQKKITDINTLPPEAIQAEMALARSGKRNFFQFRHRLTDGSVREVEVHSTPVAWQDRILLCSMVTDVTQRNLAARELMDQNDLLQRANAELTHRSEVQSALREIAEAAVLGTSLYGLFAMVHRIIRRVLPAENLYIGLRDEATGDIVRPYSAGENNAVPRRRPRGKGCTEYVMRLGRTVHITPARRAELIASGEVDIDIAGCHEWLGAPLHDSQGVNFGVLALFSSDEALKFLPEDEALLSIIAAQLSQAIQRKRAEETMVESEERYRAVMEQSPEAIIICDPDTGKIIEANSRFSERFGYTIDKATPLYIFEFTLDSRENIEAFLRQIKRDGHLSLQRRVMRHRNGSRIQVERSARLVRYRDRSLLVETLRDVSEIVRREQDLQRDAELATKVQKALLKQVEENDFLGITTIYEPHSYVGGDLYFMDWRYDGSLLRGFLLDASGHGVATALHTSALQVLLREVNDLDLPLTEQMRWLNRRTAQYFEQESFAGAVGFELDLRTHRLKWSCAGIPAVWLATAERKGILSCPGLYLGIHTDESYETHALTLRQGDAVCFVTDGFSDPLERLQALPANYESMVELLQKMVMSSALRDDATALCVKIKAWPHSVIRREGWPRQIHFNGYADYQRLKDEVAEMLLEATGKRHSLQEVAIHEALTNAMECRDGMQRSHHADFKLNLIGQRLIARIKTSRIGFAGNAMLKRLRANPAEMFAFGEDAGMGRGIPIMLSTSQYMAYNSEGTELLLAWKLESNS